MKTIDDALKHADTFDSPHTQHMSIVMLAAEVRRLRSEIDSAREDLQSFIEDRNHWKTKTEAAEAVLQNLMSYLSVNGCRTEIDPENAELRIRDGINMLVRPVLERAELAENALKEAQEQEPVAWINLNKWTPSNGPRCATHEEYEKERELLTKLTAVYAAPVPAVAVPAVPTDEQIHAAYRKALGQSIRERDMPEIRKFSHSLLQSALQPSCWCRQCNPSPQIMIVCPTCGNKRCPHANDHRNPCTGSNEPGQPGSAYPTTGDK